MEVLWWAPRLEMVNLALTCRVCVCGGQGTGKNKLADRLLQLLGMEREYVQLHRDTTVQSLTVTPTLQDGVVVWDDSPLVKAAK